MSKRKLPERGLGAAAPRLDDLTDYMPEPMRPLADVHLLTKSSAALPAHAATLLQDCGALASSSELFAASSAAAPKALS
jgi:hypothetical protein